VAGCVILRPDPAGYLQADPVDATLTLKIESCQSDTESAARSSELCSYWAHFSL